MMKRIREWLRHPTALWRLDEGAAFVRSLNAQLRPMGYHAGIVGGVINRGWSNKDLDVVIMRLRGEAPPDFLRLNMLLGQELGRWNLCGSFPTVAHDPWEVRKFYYRGRRVDAFIELEKPYEN